MGHTGRAAGGTVAAALFALLLVHGSAGAEPIELRAKVVWAHAGRAYLASSDPLPLVQGDLLKFYDGKKVAAEGSVSNILDGTLAIASIKSGSLDRSKKLDRLRITAEHPRLRPVDVLRIGIPSRSHLLFACGTTSVRSPLPRAAYRGETINLRSFILARDRSDPATAQWPDTLLVRLFDEATDEEIALERGELDVAIFWPGELSTQMRENPRWRDFSYGTRPRTVLTAVLSRDAPEFPLAPADTSALLWMNEAAFRGDLTPWDRASGIAVSLQPPAANPPPAPHRFEVDRSLPGWQTLERALRGGARASSSNTGSYPIRMILLGASATPPDPALFSFAIRCPVVCPPDLRTYLRALGPDALVSMVDCSIARGGQ
ncbi:MAG TPA: hypothetical protein VGJ98_08225 [Candidatus Eisenbacteria bacterium]